MIALYSSAQEENIYIRRQAALWKRSGLIADEQLRAVYGRTDPDVRQTNLFFRLLFLLFTLLCAGAVTGLLVWLMRRAPHELIAGMLIVFGIVYYLLAEYAVIARRFYRYGIEEALVLIAMVLFCAGVGWLLAEHSVYYRQAATLVLALLALIALWVYLRFGFLYAAAIGVTALCAIVFQWSLSLITQRFCVLFLLSAVFFFTIVTDRSGHDFQKARTAALQACLLVAIYLAVNLHLFGLIGMLNGSMGGGPFHAGAFPPFLYWTSYVLTFVLSAFGILWGIKSRKRLVLNAGLAMAVASLATNKSYWGWMRYAWDPAILGIALIALSLLITRWLNTGPGRKRYGFTADDLMKPDNAGIDLADVAAALTPGTIEAAQPEPKSPYFQDGASGGGGAQRNF
ncbi:MAG: hypothetical protein R6W75_12915 [Smithellaceae bacterium]